MVSFPSLFLWKRLLAVLLTGCLVACGPALQQDPVQQELVKKTFAGFRAAVFGYKAGVALSYLDRESLDYLQEAAQQKPDTSTTDGEVKDLLHQSMEKMTPGGIGPRFSLDVPLQRILNQGCMNTHALDSIGLGPVAVDGQTAHAEALWKGMHTGYQLTFVREDGVWKIDLLDLLPYAELALRVSRVLKNQSEEEQVDQLVSLVPAP